MAKKKHDRPTAEKAGKDPLAHIAEPLRGLAVPLEKLTLDPANARTHPEKNLEALAASLHAYGHRKPVVVNRRTGFLETGNGTLLAARMLGWTHLAAIFVDDDPATATGFAIADNRTAELAGWNQERLDELLADLKPADDDRLNSMLNDLRDLDVAQGERGTPGQQFSKMFAGIKRAKNGQYELHVRSVSGSNQGHLEEHERHERKFRADTLDELLRIGIAELRGDETFADPRFAQAIRNAVYEAQDADAEPVLDYFTCVGSVRGECGHKHATYDAAQRCNDRDQNGCASQGGYSDRKIVAVDSDGSRREPAEGEVE